MDKKEEYREKVEAQFKKWKAKIETLEARGAKLTSEAKTELKGALDRVISRFK
jgi:hypothetical protein